MKIITTPTEDEMKRFQRFVDRIATLEKRMDDNNRNVTVRVFNYEFNSNNNVYWVDVQLIKDNAGSIAKKILTDDIDQIALGYNLTIQTI